MAGRHISFDITRPQGERQGKRITFPASPEIPKKDAESQESLKGLKYFSDTPFPSEIKNHHGAGPIIQLAAVKGRAIDDRGRYIEQGYKEAHHEKVPPVPLPPMVGNLSEGERMGLALARHYAGGGELVPYRHPHMVLDDDIIPDRYRGAMFAGLAAAKHPAGLVCVTETLDGRQWWMLTDKGLTFYKQVIEGNI